MQGKGPRIDENRRPGVKKIVRVETVSVTREKSAEGGGESIARITGGAVHGKRP